jgi:O-antigen/teichoic acid export membrane protein
MLDKIKDFLKRPFFNSIIILSGGALLAQIINFICSMIMTREYTKEAIGYYSYILSIVTIFSTVVNGRYDILIVSVEDEKELNSLIKISFYLAIIISFIVMVGVYIINIFYSNNFKDDKLIIYIFPLLAIYGVINILNSFNNKYGEYKRISRAYFIRSISQNILTIGLGLFNPNSFNLLMSQTIGLCFGIKYQAKILIHSIKQIRKISISEMKDVMKKYKIQPLVSVPASFINALSYSIISLFVGNIFGMDILAIYSISVKVLGIPLGIFSTNMAKVYFKEANDEIIKMGNYKKSTLKMIMFSAILAVIMVIFLICFSPNIFRSLYGNEWYKTGIYIQLLSFMFGIRLVVGAVGFGFIIANKQKLELLFQIILLIGIIIISSSTILFKWNIEVFLIVLSGTYSVIYLIELIEIIKCSKMRRR